MTTIDGPTSLERDEIPAAVALWELCGLTRPWNDPIADARLALEGPSSTILALRGPADEVVGTAMVGFDGHRAWTYYVAVHPDSRGLGLGRVLMRAAEDWAATRSAPKIELVVRQGNDASRSFYEALGYRVEAVTVLSRRLDGGER